LNTVFGILPKSVVLSLVTAYSIIVIMLSSKLLLFITLFQVQWDINDCGGPTVIPTMYFLFNVWWANRTAAITSRTYYIFAGVDNKLQYRLVLPLHSLLIIRINKPSCINKLSNLCAYRCNIIHYYVSHIYKYVHTAQCLCVVPIVVFSKFLKNQKSPNCKRYFQTQKLHDNNNWKITTNDASIIDTMCHLDQRSPTFWTSRTTKYII
jgi:hypothetical protein